jgi:Cys-rich protein (TIGR01571 family)
MVVAAPGQPQYVMAQPGQMVVAAGTQQAAHPSLNQASRIMMDGLCGCFDDLGICLISYFCPCCQFGMNAQRVNIGNCIVCGLLYALFPCCVGAVVRGKIYRLANLPDPGFCGNCCMHCCCWCCAVAQEGRATVKLAEAGIMSRD